MSSFINNERSINNVGKQCQVGYYHQIIPHASINIILYTKVEQQLL